jgi:hypothetical protein
MPANAEPSQVGMTGNVSWDFLIMVRLKNFQDRLPPELKDASNFRSHERQGSHLRGNGLPKDVHA